MLLAGLIVGAICIALGAPKVGITQAAFTGAAEAAARPVAGVMSPPLKVTCAQGTGGTAADNRQTIVLNWGQPTTAGVTPSKYLITAQITHNYGQPLSGTTVRTSEEASDKTSTSLDIKNTGGLLGGLLGLLGDLLISYDYTISVKFSAEYANGWTSQAVEFKDINATNTALIGQKRLTCQDQ